MELINSIACKVAYVCSLIFCAMAILHGKLGWAIFFFAVAFIYKRAGGG